MSNDVDVDLNLDPTGWLSGASAVAQGSTQAAQALGALAVAHRSVSAVLGSGIPGKAAFAAFTAAAASAQQQMVGLRQQQIVTGQSATQLERSIRSMSESFPVGTSGANAMVQTLQQLGITSSSQTGQLQQLAKQFITLGGSTGESATQLGTLQVQLSRLYGNLDPSRITKMDDALVTVSRTAGASATAVLSFANSIAPLARAAGIGQTAIMGISAQMASLGEDGGGAATALNKVFSDLNQSVVDGSSQLATYARVVGMTTQQFKQLYQANPSQAIVDVTNALAAPGQQGQRNLQELGFDGVRTQVALQALAQSGGLQGAIATATGAYGNGMTSKTAAPAFDTLESQLEKLGSTAGNIADSFGTPLLSASTKVAGAFEDLLKPLQAMVQSGVFQGIEKIAGYVAVLGPVAMGAGALGIKGVIAQRLVNSGPLSSYRAGRALGRAGGDVDAAVAQLERSHIPGSNSAAAQLRYFGNGQRDNNGNLINGTARQDEEGRWLNSKTGLPLQMGNANYNSYAMGYGRNVEQDIDGGVQGKSRGVLGTLWGLGARTYASGTTSILNNAFVDPSERSATKVVPGTGPLGFAAAMSQMFSGARSGDLDSFKSGVSKIGDAGEELSRRVAGNSLLMRLGPNLGPAIGGTVGAAASVGTATAGYAARGLGALAGGLMSPMGLALAGIPLAEYGISKFEHRNDDLNNSNNLIEHGDIYQTMNAYSDALGKAGVATMSFAQIAESAASQLKTTTGATVQGAQTVTLSDVIAGGKENSKSRNLPSGMYANMSAQAMAARLNATSVQGIDPQTAQAMKLDLLNFTGGDQAKVQAVMNALNITTTPSATETASVGDLFAGVKGTFAVDPNKPLLLGKTDNGQGAGKAGTVLKTSLSKSSVSAYDQALQALGQNEMVNQNNYGAAYGQQQLQQQVSQLYSQTYGAVGSDLSSKGNKILLQNAERAIDPTYKGNVTQADMTRAGGNLALAMTYANKTYAATYQSGQSAKFQPDPETKAIAGAGGGLAQFFTNDPTKGLRGPTSAIRAAYNAPENQGAQVAGASAILAAGSKLGMSFQDIANSASKFGASLDASSQYLTELAIAVQVAQGHATAAAAGLTTGQQASLQISQGNQLIANSKLKGQTDAQAQQDYTQGNADLDTAQSTLEQQNDQELTSYRNYLIQRGRSEQEYQIQSDRSWQDYGIAVAQANQDQQIQVLRSQQDYQLQRTRSYQDFATQMARMVQDAETSLYNPFQRIQAQPVFDAQTLLANLAQQQQAMIQQTQNLQKIGQMGLSTNAIQTLGLASSSNAQQLNQLVSDAMSNPAVIAQLNKAMGSRATATKGLVENTDNTDYARQVADFNLQQARATQDFATSMSRQAQDFDKTMTRQAQAFELQRERALADQNLALSESEQDFNNTLNVISGSLASTNAQVQKMLSGQTVQWTDITVNSVKTGTETAKNLLTQLANTAVGNGSSKGVGGVIGSITGALGNVGADLEGAILAAGGGAISTTTSQQSNYADKKYDPAAEQAYALSQFNKYGWNKNEMPALVDLWNMESGWDPWAVNYASGASGIPQALGHGTVFALGDWKAQIDWGLEYIKGRYKTPDAAWAHEMATSPHWYASGSIFSGQQVIGVGERGPEAVIPLNEQGMSFMAGVMTRAVSLDDVHRMAAAQARSPMQSSAPQSYTQANDYTQSFAGANITVVSQNPDAIASALARRERTDALTAGRR